MKQIRLSSRFLALLLAVIMLFTLAACGDNAAKPADGGSSSSPETSSASEAPAFINPLPDVDLSRIIKAEPPAADLLAKINTAFNQNNDVVGWLSVPNTTIDNEVMQTTDNVFYERKDITKGYNWYGCYWADFEGAFGDRNTISKNTVIYGHSMDDNPEGVKFSQLKKFLDPEFAAANPYIYFSTPEDNMVWKVFAVADTDKWWSYNHPNLTNAKFMKLVNEGKERSTLIYDVDVNANDKTLLLSTCAYPSDNKEIYEQARFVIMARLVRPGEKLEATVKVEKNPNPIPPTIKTGAE